MGYQVQKDVAELLPKDGFVFMYQCCNPHDKYVVAIMPADANQWTKILTKKDGSKFLTRVGLYQIYVQNALFTDCIHLLSAIFDRVSQHLSYAQKRRIIEISWV